jgi:hypothetical protein
MYTVSKTTTMVLVYNMSQGFDVALFFCCARGVSKRHGDVDGDIAEPAHGPGGKRSNVAKTEERMGI